MEKGDYILQMSSHFIRINAFKPLLQSLLHQKVDYCGSTLPHEFYSLGENAKVLFASDSQNGGRFRLEYSLASRHLQDFFSRSHEISDIFTACNRTYDEDYGRILSPRWPYRMRTGTVCIFNIQASPGKKISLYFGNFGIPNRVNCTRGAMEVI